jgi:hypothetical protein
MIYFNELQLDILEEQRRKAFAQKLVERARRVHAESQKGVSDQALTETLTAAILRARRLELKTRGQMERFADLWLALGPEFDRKRPWAREILARDGLRPAEKLAELEACAVFVIREDTSSP